MRNLKLGLFTMLAMITAGIGFTAAFEIQVGPQDYYGTLTLNRINIMKNYGLTGIVLDGTGYEISIASGGTPGYGKISVYQICGQGGGNCKEVSQLSTTTPVMNSINDDGLVEKTNGEANKVRKTNTEGKPQWLDDADTHYTNTLTINGGGTQAVKFTQDNNAILNITGGSNTSVSTNGNTITISSNDSDTHYTHALTINGSGTQAIKFSQDSSKTLNIKGSGNVSVSVNSSTNSADIIITSTGGGGTSLRQTGSNNILKPKLNSYELGIGNTGIVLKGSGYQYCNDYGSFVYGPVIGYESSLVLKQYSSTYECVTSFIAINMNGLGIGGIPTQNDNLLINGSAKINGNYLRNNKVGLQKIPTSAETLQVYGGIQITENNTPYNNKTCDESLEGSIEYYSGNFYGCNGSKRKAFSFGAAL